MDSKKAHAASFKEGSPPSTLSPSSAVFRPRSPFRSGRSAPGPSRASSETTFGCNPDADGLSQPISCVTRETILEDCARHRFIVWAAVKRNACPRMKPEEKLRCPLLRCSQHFPNHELMLRHLAGCEHLASGEYLCPEHMRVEHFDDVKCKHCLGHPSKRRRMLSFAKNFFHTIGHRSKKGNNGYDVFGEDTLSPPPPPYVPSSLPPQLADPTELSSANEIVEADSREIRRPPLPTVSVEAVIDPQELLIPSMPELDSTILPPLSSTPLMPWYPTTQQNAGGLSIPVSPSSDTDVYSSASRPTLQVNTFGLQGWRKPAPRAVSKPAPQPTSRSKHLSPSSSVRSNASTDSNISATSNDSSLVSPMSNWSGAWSMASDFQTTSGFNTNLTSPIDGCLADTNPFAMPSANPLTSLHDFYSELPAEVPDVDKAGDMSSDPLLLSSGQDTPSDLSYSSDLVPTEDSDLLDFDALAIQENSVCWSDTKLLVRSVWDALQEHILSSTLKTQHVFGNPLSDQIRSMSTQTVATAGIRTLRALLDGEKPCSAIDTLCFTHLAFAFSLVIHEQAAADRSKDLFLQTLSYATDLGPGEMDPYTQLTSLIWQPHDISTELVAKARRSSVVRGKQAEAGTTHSATYPVDPLLTAALDFLDELEISVLLGQASPSQEGQDSGLFMKHLFDYGLNAVVNTPFPFAVNVGIQGLLMNYQDTSGLGDRLAWVRQLVASGEVASVRRLELELIRAGKGSMDTSRYYNNYVSDVRKMCDMMYEHHGSGVSRRQAYYDLGIALIENILPELDSDNEQLAMAVETDDIDIDDFMQGLTPDYEPQSATYVGSDTMADMFGNSMLVDVPGLDNTVQQELHIITPAATPPSNQDIPSAGPSGTQAETEQQPAPQPQQQQQQHEVTLADACCHICNYRPKGAPQWFKGSMAKHMKTKHSGKETYKCPFPGCTSQYTNRKDNLRQHQIEKGHFVDGEEPAVRRPSKRKKRSHDDDENE